MCPKMTYLGKKNTPKPIWIRRIIGVDVIKH